MQGKMQEDLSSMKQGISLVWILNGAVHLYFCESAKKIMSSGRLFIERLSIAIALAQKQNTKKYNGEDKNLIKIQ